MIIPSGNIFTLHYRFAGQQFDAESGLHNNFFRFMILIKAASGCKALSRCNNTFKAKLAAAQACYSGRSIYVSIGCDRVIKTTKNHPGQAAQAKRAWQNCQTHAKKICKCKK